MATTATRPSVDETTRTSSRRTAATGVVADAAVAVKGAADDAASRLPEAAATGRSAFDDANRRIAASSDEMVRLGTAVSFGFAVGLLIGGANRILVGAAFVPVCMLGFTLLDRFAGERTTKAGTKGASGL
jgi:hypothetical protein